ncbi:hypothetical protein [Nocardia amamiensis]|uniref:hypothetical protein n=1 Tax=Nocardia amamiensis TaxID=404578 RepID=UPI00082FEE56|nr:hypothetical protein [Nocardia amamiensis]
MWLARGDNYATRTGALGELTEQRHIERWASRPLTCEATGPDGSATEDGAHGLLVALDIDEFPGLVESQPASGQAENDRRTGS